MIEKIQISTDTGNSTVLLGEGLSNLIAYLPDTKIIVITDNVILKHYHTYFSEYNLIEIGTGEQVKTLDTIAYILEKLVEFEADRTSFIVGIGGGIVCDIVGFAASVFMRGLRFGFVSTSLLSQVDASVGGKNGVNFQGYKNMVGVFAQPEFVICDFEMLKTLDEKEFISGFAEIVKAAAIRNAKLFDFLETNYSKALAHDLEAIHYAISESVKIKAAVVEADEKEKGERKILNFGHTFAHSIEKIYGIRHGEAVSIGMMMAARLSQFKGLLKEEEVTRLEKLLVNIGLPVRLEIDKPKLLDAMKKDKKRDSEKINFILLDKIGNAIIYPMTIKEVEEVINDLC
jgi:3-dehydroquinate synthase